MTRRRWKESGSATVELVIIAPGLLAIIALLIIGGRIAIAGGAVEHAAAEAARAASIARTAAQANNDGNTVANTVLANAGLTCVGGAASVSLDLSGFSRPVGEPASVSATVVCEVEFSDVALPGMPGTRTMTETVTSPLDTFRTRQ
jgi:Flp pilus assembly protein TadG